MVFKFQAMGSYSKYIIALSFATIMNTKTTIMNKHYNHQQLKFYSLRTVILLDLCLQWKLQFSRNKSK